jgi:large subunit ribosomal protein L25
MEKIVLEVEQREDLGKSKVRDLRKTGFIPAVIYSKGKESQAIKVSQSHLLKLLHQHRLENAIISLRINPARKASAAAKDNSSETKDAIKQEEKTCLIKEMQHDPVKDNIIHVDFNEISLTQTIKVSVPVLAKGEPIGVKQEGGSLEHILWKVEVECLPADIPQDIEVDVSQLQIGDSIHIKDINFPPNVKVLNSIEAVVLSVAAPLKEEVVAAPVEGEEKLEPEVIKEKKEVPAEEEAKESTKEQEKKA